jgi:transposase
MHLARLLRLDESGSVAVPSVEQEAARPTWCRPAGNQRLHQRWLHFSDRKKKPAVANVAVARALAGWCWSLAVMDD